MSLRRWTCAVLALTLLPGVAQAWWNDEWAGRKPFKIDTSATGAAINDPIGDAPVLIRLHSGNFKFELAKEDGSDIRFVAADDKTPLPFHIEKWDPLLGEGLIWVGVPDLKPGTKTDIWAYYKNPKAAAGEDAKATFDKSTTLVYHFADKGQPPRDFTVWANHATTAGIPAEGALIGRGLKLDGAGTVSIPAATSLAWAAGAKMTWSAWVKPAEAEATGVVFSRRDNANAFAIAFDKGKPYVEVDTVAGPRRAGAPEPMTASWHHLAVTSGETIVLYVDGSPVAKVAGTMPALNTALVLGGESAPAATADSVPRPRGPRAVAGAAPAPAAKPGFKGELEELQISKVERPEGFLKFAVASQGTDPSKLIAAGQEEESASFSSGYLGVIVRSVTLDGWVVIGLLGVMGFISFYVMARKAGQLAAVEKANEAFSAAFRERKGDLVELIRSETNGASLGDPKRLARSSLYQLYEVGAEEIRRRTKGGQALSPHAIESIRASLDAGLVREGQKLNRHLVLLTIAIAGGPFLGLLGTVVGVMITFAAIAAAGDVNVNAIAPGIAAALVATVAGLAVAIPNLFGYNWLLARVKNVVATQQVFADEFLTSAAEAHSHHENRAGATRAPVAVAEPAQ